MQARNAHFNLNRLGVIVDTFADNFYGTDYNADPAQGSGSGPGLQSDRLFANWKLNAPRVAALASGSSSAPGGEVVGSIGIPFDWSTLVRNDVELAREEQLRVRTAFKQAFDQKLVCAGFARDPERSAYLLFERDTI
jgi:predicted GNAT superfamily acetyltransferase